MKAVYPANSRRIGEAKNRRAVTNQTTELGVQPIERFYFSIGKRQPLKKGFQILDACVQCGSCLRSCPQQCIETGQPYIIVQKNCLHCGLCAEVCPVHAVIKRT